MSHDHGNTDENLPPRSPHHARRTVSVGMVVDSPTAVGGMAGGSETLDVDAHIIINTNPMDSGPKGHMDRIGSIGVGGVDVGADDDGFAAAALDLEQNVLNDDLAAGAPPRD